MRRSRGGLPEADASVDRLDDEDRRWLAYAWGGRAASELNACNSFELITEALRDAGAEPELEALARRAIVDEAHHSRICHRMASIYLGAEAPALVAPAHAVPAHEGAPEMLRRTLHILGQCCLNETTGSAFYEMCLVHARAKPARTALLALLSDEVDHARVGWAHLASPRLSLELREDVGRWLHALIVGNLRSWRQRRGAVPDRSALAEHGFPSFEAGDRTVLAALDDLIVPGFALAGFDVRAVARAAIEAVPSIAFVPVTPPA